MSIVSFVFVLFYLFTFTVYHLINKKKWIVLLLSSMVFYCIYDVYLIWPVLISAISIWICGLSEERINLKYNIYSTTHISEKEKKNIRKLAKKDNKIVLILTIAINIFLLLYFKFWNVIASNVIKTEGIIRFALPLAISFYTLSAIGYIIDVYRGEKAEKNFFKILLFLIYFPLLTQGPIVRYSKVKETLYTDNKFHYNKFKNGILLVIWGGYKKLVISDRLFPLVDAVFMNYISYSGPIIILAIFAYAVQLYCDFSGGIDIIRGCSEMLGVLLPENFERPYFSKNIGEFWRRWHISLGEWFKDYVFLPLSISKFNNKVYKLFKKSKVLAKQMPTYIILFIIWFLNGIWHGAGLKYVFFGIYMGIIIIVENIIKNNNIKTISNKYLNITKTFCLVCIGWIFIRVNKATDILPFIRQIFKYSNTDIVGQIKTFYSDMDLFKIGFSIVLLFVASLIQRKETVRGYIERKPLPVRWGFYYASIFTFILFIYGEDLTKGFIYAQY